MNSVLVKHQVKTFEKQNILGYKLIKVKLRYDDSCGNGHNTFSITGEAYETQREITKQDPSTCGCIHDIIEKAFPELKHLIKWHLVGSKQPLHYLANTLYHASDRDHYGMAKGELRQRKSKNGLLWDQYAILDGKELPIKEALAAIGGSWLCSESQPENKTLEIVYRPCYRIGEGKEPDLQAARNCAIWPDATLEQLQNKDLLLARLPALMLDFKKDIEAIGFTF